MSLEINESYVIYSLDTGAQAHFMPKPAYFKRIRRPKLNVTRVKLTVYRGSLIPAQGKCVLTTST